MNKYLVLLMCAALAGCGSSSDVQDQLGDELIDATAVTTSLHDKVGASVILDAHEVHCGHESDHSLVYRWTFLTKPGGSAAQLTASDQARAQFDADIAGTYEALVDISCLSYAAKELTFTAEITSLSENAKPVAQTPFLLTSYKVGALVTLDGSKSYDKDGDAITFAWTLDTKPAGSVAAFDDASLATPSFIADLAGDYSYTLRVNDGTVDSDPVALTITAKALNVNAAPVANAGIDQSVTKGSMVTLHGLGSHDPEGDTLSYKWSLNSEPPGSNMLASIYGSASGFDRTTAEPQFTPSTEGTYAFKLEVSDGTHTSTPDLVSIVVNAPPHTADLASKLMAMGLDSTDANYLVANHKTEAEYVVSVADPIFGGVVISNDMFVGPSADGHQSFDGVYTLINWEDRHRTRLRKAFGRVAFVINSQRFEAAFTAQAGLLDPTHQGTAAVNLPGDINNFTNNPNLSIVFPANYSEFKEDINSVLDAEHTQNNRKLNFFLSSTSAGTAYGIRPLRLGVEKYGMMGDASADGKTKAWDVNGAAGLVMHEIMHSIGYAHDPNGDQTALKPNNIPYFVQIIASYQETDILNKWCGGVVATCTKSAVYGYPSALLTHFFGNN